MIVRFGGSGYPFGIGAGHQYMDETYTFDGVGWTKLATGGPPKRDRQMMVAY